MPQYSDHHCWQMGHKLMFDPVVEYRMMLDLNLAIDKWRVANKRFDGNPTDYGVQARRIIKQDLKITLLEVEHIGRTARILSSVYIRKMLETVR